MGFDPVGVLQTLQRHDVRFVVIGGVAARLWGSPTITNDIDICFDRDPANLERLASALIELEARLRGVEDDIARVLNATTLANVQDFTFTTNAGPLDVMSLSAGTKEFNQLAVNASQFDLGDGVIAAVCYLDDLIRMKRAAGRPKDRIELEILAAVREERDRSPHR